MKAKKKIPMVKTFFIYCLICVTFFSCGSQKNDDDSPKVYFIQNEKFSDLDLEQINMVMTNFKLQEANTELKIDNVVYYLNYIVLSDSDQMYKCCNDTLNPNNQKMLELLKSQTDKYMFIENLFEIQKPLSIQSLKILKIENLDYCMCRPDFTRFTSSGVNSVEKAFIYPINFNVIELNKSDRLFFQNNYEEIAKKIPLPEE